MKLKPYPFQIQNFLRNSNVISQERYVNKVLKPSPSKKTYARD